MASAQHDETQVIRDDRGPGGAGGYGPRGWWDDFDPYTAVAVLGSLIGAFVLIVGIVTIARTGIPVDDLTAGTTVVGPYDRTTLMGLIEIVVGLSFIGAGASRHSAGLFALGLLTGVFGIVWLIEPNAFDDALGIDRATAWTYLLFGLASSLVGGWAGSRADRVVVRR